MKTLNPSDAEDERLEGRAPERRRHDRPGERADAEGGREEAERPRPDVQRVGGEQRHERVEVEPDQAEAGDDDEHDAHLPVVPAEGEPFARAREHLHAAVPARPG